MAHAPYLREKARQMRVDKKLTIDELAERLALSRSTVYYWVKDLPIEGSGSGGPFHALAADPTFRDFVCLYLAEGYKRDRNSVAICNSDPAVMVLALRWLRHFARNPLEHYVAYHADQDLEELRRFWAGALGLVPGDIGGGRKSNSGQLAGRTWRSRHGVLTIRTSDTLFRSKLEAWMDCLKASWA